MRRQRRSGCWRIRQRGEPERTSRVMQIRYDGLDVRIGRIGEQTDDFCRGDEFAQNLEPFRCHRHLEKADAGDIATRPVEALDKTKSDRVGAHVEYDGNRRSRSLRGGQRGGTAHGNNDGNLPFDQVRSERGQPIKLTLRPAEFDRHVAAFDKASFVQASANGGHVFGVGRRWRSQDADDRHRRCCARAASGHAAAAPPSSVMNSRRLMPNMGLPPTGAAADHTS